MIQCYLFQSEITVHDSMLFVSTLNGRFHAISKQTGKQLWTLNEGEQPLVTNLNVFQMILFAEVASLYDCSCWWDKKPPPLGPALKLIWFAVLVIFCNLLN